MTSELGSVVSLADLSFWRITSIPRQDARDPDLMAAGLRAALVGSFGAGEKVASVWCRPKPGDSLRYYVGGGRSLVAGADESAGGGLLFPPGARGERAGRTEIDDLMAACTHWTRCVLLTSSTSDGQHVQPDFDDYLEQLSASEFVWMVSATPLAADEVERAVREQQAVIQSLLPRAERSEVKLELEKANSRFRELADGGTTGLWQTEVVAGAADPYRARRAAVILSAGVGEIGGRYSIRPAPPRRPDGTSVVLGDQESSSIVGTRAIAELCRPAKRELPGLRLHVGQPFDVTPEVDGTLGDESQFRLGVVLDDGERPAGAFEIRAATLLRHAFVCGATGSGKSQTVRHLLEQLSAAEPPIPWLVIEPTKAEYQLMAGRLGDAAVATIRPGAVQAVPVMLNPLEWEPGFSLQAHIDMVKALFLAAFQPQEPFPQVISQALNDAYTRFGWNLATGTNSHPDRPPEYPTLGDLLDSAEDVVRKAGYGDEVTANVRGFVSVRLSSLRQGTPGRLFEGGHPIDVDKLLSSNVVIEIEDVGSDVDKAFVIGAMLIRIIEHLRVRAAHRGSRNVLRHVIVLEEAHRLLRRTTDTLTGAAVDLFASLLSEIRAYGVGMIVVEQIPAKILPDVVKNSALKVVHRLPARDDRDLVGSTMNLNERQSEYVVSLRPGHAAMFADGMDRPVLVRVPLGEDRERAAEAAAIAPPVDVSRRRWDGCSERCHEVRPCTTLDLERARARADNAQLTLWAELATVGHIAGRAAPSADRDWLVAALAAFGDEVVLECAVAQAAQAAMRSRRDALLAWYDPRELAAHVASSMRLALAGGGECPDGEWRFQAGPFRWEDVVRQLKDGVLRGLEGRHPNSDDWAERGLVLPGSSCRDQLAVLRDLPVHRMSLGPFLFGASEPSLLERAVGTQRQAPDWTERLRSVTGFLSFPGNWHLLLTQR